MEKDILVSICIPAYEMIDRGYDFLDFSFSKIYNQTYKNIEVVVSDQSNDYSIMRVCSKWSDKINIKYLKEYNRGKSSMNINNALSKANGELVKILFQDDFLYKDDSIEITVNEHNKHNKNWYISSFVHTKDGNYIDVKTPEYTKYVYSGENTVGTPSVLTYKNEKDYIKFSDDLIWLMDCEYYKRLFDKYGEPHIIKDVTVAVRIWEGNYSVLISDEIKDDEYKYVISKYGELDNKKIDKKKIDNPNPFYQNVVNNKLNNCICGELKNKIRYNFCQKCNKIY